MNVIVRIGMCALLCIGVATTESTEIECSHANPCPLKGGLPLVRCPELISKEGYLEIELIAEVGIFTFEWLELPRRSYSGLKCPPTWRVKPGDVINVTLINRLNEGTHIPGMDPAQNITNLHTHGLHISPLEPQDNSFVAVKPGESYRYSFKIMDDHPAGTYWYHSHHHRATTLQNLGGMAGIIIVEDDPKQIPPELEAVSCPENCENDISLTISPMLKMAWFLISQNLLRDSLRISPDLEKWLEGNVDYFTVNGEIQPVISLKQNQMTRFRILNVGFVTPMELRVIDEDEKDAPCEIREIAADGIYLDRPTPPRFGQSLILPGGRIDWLIKCTNAGTYKIYSHAKAQHHFSFADMIRQTIVIATIEVRGDRTVNPVSDFPQTLPPRPQHLNDLRHSEPDQYIVVEVGGDFSLNREKWTGPTNFRYKVEVDSLVEIQLINPGYDYSHPIHFHVNHAQVIGFQPYTGPVTFYNVLEPNWELRDQNGELCYYQHKGYVEGAAPESQNASQPLKYKGQYEWWMNSGNNTLGYQATGLWLDTVLSPALSNMTLRMKVDKFTGPMIIHCHMPLDSDLGMTMVIDIVEKGGDLNGANILSGNAAPGSCKRCEWNRFVDIPSDCAPAENRLPSDVILNLLLSLLMATQRASNTPTLEFEQFGMNRF